MKTLDERIMKLKKMIEELNNKLISQLYADRIDEILLMHKAGK